jgi:hypothetical protein
MMKLLTRRGVLLEDDGQSLGEPNGPDRNAARTTGSLLEALRWFSCRSQ